VCTEGWVARGPATNVRVTSSFLTAYKSSPAEAGLSPFHVRCGTASALLLRAVRFAYERMSLLAEKAGCQGVACHQEFAKLHIVQFIPGGMTGDSIVLRQLSMC
jgi:hypothetical protein